MDKKIIKLVQKELAKETGVPLVVDGDAGRKTQGALQQISQIPAHWNVERQLIGYVQYLCMKNGINAGPLDGRWGPQTEYAYDELEQKLAKSGWFSLPWRTDEGEGDGDEVGKIWPLQTQSELEKYYGKVGTNQTKITCPYKLKIAWDLDKTITRFSCHEKVADSMGRVFDRVQDHYGDQISDLGLDLFGGCLNVRKMRGGSKWSTHSWGIALDWDPARNRLKWHKDRANFAKPEYDMWWKLWEEEGWVSLGRNRDYDWMHVQAAKVKKR